MSVIQRIQQRQKWVFGAIALALILFIVQDRLMGKGSSLTGPSNTVGKVNGESIDRQDFLSEEEIVKQMQQRDLDADELSAGVWQEMVNQKVMDQEFAKLGLVYTNNEFGEDIGSNNPPSFFAQQFRDPQTGIYNAEQAKSYMQNVGPQLRKSSNTPQALMFQKGVLDASVNEGLAKKYGALITGAVYIPKWMAAKNAADNATIASISYVSVPYTSIADSTVKVSDDEINDYVKRHAKQFEQKDETRQVAYVSFDAFPSKNDTDAVLATVAGYKGEFAAAQDPKSFLEEKGTGMQYNGSYLAKSQIHQPVNDSLFKLQPGQIYGPYLDGGSYVMAKMIDTKQLPDSAKVRHILVATMDRDQQTGQFTRVRDDSSAQKRLDSAIALIKAGANFDSVCLKYSDDGTKTKGGVYDYFPTGNMVEEFNNFVFTGKTGDKQVVHTEYGFHYVEILGQKGSEPAYKIAYLSKPITVSQETDQNAQNAATAFAGNLHSVKDLYDAAAKAKKTPMVVSGIKENDYLVGQNMPGGGLGKGKPFVQWVFKNDVGDVSQAFRFDQKYVVAVITAINKPGLLQANLARPIVESQVRIEKKAKIIKDTKIKGSTLDAIAQANNVTVQQADSISFQQTVIGNLGQEPAVVGAAFNKQLQGKVSPAITGLAGVYVIQGKSIAGVASNQGSAETQRTNAMLSLKAREIGGPNYMGQQQMPPYQQVLLKAADIKDNRASMYQQ